LDGEVISDAAVLLPLKTMNRHGLIAGATGTGKTKTLQVLSEILSDASVPVVMMDIKGDLSGIAAAGLVNDKITERVQKLNVEFKPTAYHQLKCTGCNDGYKRRSKWYCCCRS
jgi:Cdc6-like AAA superfamily ATPase